MRGVHLLKTWSSTQKNITLSSGEAELVAAVKAAAESIGVCRMAHDWGDQSECTLHVDSSAAIGMVHRRGSGKLRHIKIGQLWIQERVEEGEISVKKVPGEHNSADLLTKHVAEKRLLQPTDDMTCDFRQGRADSGLQLAG